MRYLKYRNDFLKAPKLQEINLKESLKTSTLVNESLENDIRWGDSLLGRLINSAIRCFKIGYNEQRITKIIDQLDDALNQLVSESFTKDLSEKYNYLMIKSLLQQIKDVCYSTLEDEDKLNKLLGWDKNPDKPMWDAEDPSPDIPGLIENGRIISSEPSIMQKVIDVITEKLPNLKKLIGVEKDDLLDSLSDFTVELRKLTVSKEKRGYIPKTLSSFSINFGKILHKTELLTDSYKLNNYNVFLNLINEGQESQEAELKSFS
jgi:flagellin-specific chaperone FliS